MQQDPVRWISILTLLAASLISPFALGQGGGYSQGLLLAHAGKYADAEQVLRETPVGERSSLHHYLLSSCYAKLERPQDTLTSAIASLKDTSGLPTGLRPEAIKLLEWAAFSLGVRNIAVLSIFERFKQSTKQLAQSDSLALEAEAAHTLDLAEVREQLAHFPELDGIWQDVELAATCANWTHDQVFSPGLGMFPAIECTSGGKVAVVYGGRLLALFKRYELKRETAILPK